MTDRAGREYWERAWDERGLPPPLDPFGENLSCFVDREMDRFLTRAFAGLQPGARFLEVGCGSSAWLPYVARRFGFQVSGVDYADLGVAQAEAMLRREGVEGRIVKADLFDPPADLVGAFDVVLSNGVVEHFEDTAGVLRAMARFAKPGGRVVTVVPNMHGAPGAVQRVLDRDVFDVHVPLSRERLRAANEEAGLRVEIAEYHFFVNFGVCNVPESARGAGATARRALHKALVDASRLVWVLETHTRPLPANRFLSPYVVAVGRADR